MTTKKISDTKPSSTRVQAPGKDLAELATVSHDTAEREQAGRKELGKRCRHLEKVVLESTATIKMLRGQLRLERNERKWAERDIRAALKYADDIIATVPASLLVLNADLRVTSANRSFYETFKVTSEETVGQCIYELGNRQWDIPRFRELLEHILPQHTTIEGFEMEHEFPALGRRVMLLNAHRIFRESNHADLVLLVIDDITERKKSEEALKLLNTYNRSLIEVSLDPLVTIGSDGRIKDVNAATEAATGYAREQLIGTDFSDYFTDPEKARAGYQQVFRDGEVFDYALDLLHRDGHVTSVLYNASVYRDETGKVSGVFAAARDITERKRAEEALKLANTYNRSLIEVSLDPLVTIGSDGRIKDVNAATEAATGYAREQLIGTDFSDYFTDPEKARAGYRQVFRDGEVFDYALDLRHRDGHVISVLYNASVYRDETGRVSGVFAAARDITERKRVAEELQKHREHLEELVEQRTRELRENENKYRTLFESSTDAIMTLDENSFIDCNTATLKMFGCNPKSEFSILHPADISPPNQPDGTDSRAAADLRIAEAFKKGSAQFEWIHRTRNGQDFPAEVLLSAFKLGGKQVLQATVRDITERRRMEEQLRRSEKLAVLGQLAGGVGHELRNPLGAIKNAAYFLNMVLEQPEPEVKETLEILDKEVASCEHIISSLLEFARQKPPTKHRTDIADIIQRTLSHMRVPEKVEVVSQHDRALPLILADPDQLSQVFDNVILNAVQAMPEGGQLVIKYSVPEPGWVAISFTDTGVGMSPEAMKSLFQPLFTTKAKGIGLGLAIVKTLVEGHKGTIEVQSELGEGSTFTVKLPISGG